MDILARQANELRLLEESRFGLADDWWTTYGFDSLLFPLPRGQDMMDFHPKQTHVRMITQESGCTRTRMIPWYTRKKHWSDVRPTRKYCVEFLDYFLEALESNAPWPSLEILLEDYTIKCVVTSPGLNHATPPYPTCILISTTSKFL